MAMELRRFWLSSELSKSVTQQLLVVNVNILVSEEYNTSLGNCYWSGTQTSINIYLIALRTENCQVANLSVVM